MYCRYRPSSEVCRDRKIARCSFAMLNNKDFQTGARALHGTSTAGHGTARHGTVRHGSLAVPCRVVPPCSASGPGTALSTPDRAVPCHWARQSSVLVPCLGTNPQNHIKISENREQLKYEEIKIKKRTPGNKISKGRAVQWLPH